MYFLKIINSKTIKTRIMRIPYLAPLISRKRTSRTETRNSEESGLPYRSVIKELGKMELEGSVTRERQKYVLTIRF